MNNCIKILILVLLLINSFLLTAKKENKTSRYSTIINSEDADLKERLFGSNICPITHGEIEHPVIVPCCNNKFELTSLTEYFQFQK